MAHLLAEDLDFHQHTSSYATHNLHAFPAKFPPQLPPLHRRADRSPRHGARPHDGPGTTVLEAYLADRRSLGFDIDPLALLLGAVKVTPLDVTRAAAIGVAALEDAQHRLHADPDALRQELDRRFDPGAGRSSTTGSHRPRNWN
ncbi:MAG: hypothetical protein HZY76_09560 [Anaerolineae bacterium]|nr:MAG: hypothetical protein HZY76_09560 [Anaerolineae bacterium]